MAKNKKMQDDLLEFLVADPTPEIEFLIEKRSREVKNEQDVAAVKKYCIALIRENVYKDNIMSVLLGEYIKIQTLKAEKEKNRFNISIAIYLIKRSIKNIFVTVAIKFFKIVDKFN
tara:strand:+ start:452 stop:799 length:348 start_codon:yes stop_codon:yes gene_type:complete